MTQWTCPMHPEIVRDGPGSCPKCGMALGMYHLIPGLQFGHILPIRAQRWLELALASPVVLWGAWPFFVRGWQSVVNRSPNMFTLIGLGVMVAYLFSGIAVVFPWIFPASFRGESGEVDVYFEAAAAITVLVLLGQVLELKARGRTGAAIRALLGLAPKTARRVRAGKEEDVPLEHVVVGDILRVRPGEKVPVDGRSPRGRRASTNRWFRGSPYPSPRSPGRVSSAAR